MKFFIRAVGIVTGVFLVILALFFMMILPRSFFIFSAPEIGRTYVLTRDAVVTPRTQLIPETVYVGRTVTTLMTPEAFQANYDAFVHLHRRGLAPMPPEGQVVLKGSQLFIKRMFTYHDFNGSSRYVRGRLSDLERGDYTVYAGWEEYFGTFSYLEEVKTE